MVFFTLVAAWLPAKRAFSVVLAFTLAFSNSSASLPLAGTFASFADLKASSDLVLRKAYSTAPACRRPRTVHAPATTSKDVFIAAKQCWNPRVRG